MMKALICIFFFMATACLAWAGEEPYAIKNIPDSLLKKADVIKRTETIRYVIAESNKTKVYHKVAYTILNERADKWGMFAKGYDKLESIESFEGSLFDANGKKIKSLKKSDIKDVSGSDDASLADDNRMKWHSFFYKAYPYTVEYEVELSYKGTMFLPRWTPQERTVMSVQQSSITVSVPANNALHYKMYRYNGQPLITDDKSNKIYSWQVTDLPTQTEEYAAPAWYRLTCTVLMSTDKFFLQDYEGSNATWKDFGKFVYDLKKERDVLPFEVKQKVHQLTDGLSDQKKKIKVLYEYMQQNTRYVGIQLGVGGWQPFDANYVASKKYGDCKALSNYMYSLLKEAGIRSVYTVIRSGGYNDYLVTDLPSSQFNHAVLFVPMNNDTTWLECTSQTRAMGFFGAGTGNRYALAVDENGGTLVKTPFYGRNENRQIRNVAASINEAGHLQAIVKTSYEAEQQESLHYIINGLSKDKLMEHLKESLELATYDVRSYNYKEEKNELPVIYETLDLLADNYATVSGKRFFVLPNIFSRARRKLEAIENRKNDLILETEFTDIDTVHISIPSGYAVESIPKDVSITSKFGKYESVTKLAADKIIYYRLYENYSGHFPAADYEELRKFYDVVYKTDRNKIVLLKTDSAVQKAF